MSNIAIIPARAGSQGVPGKNIKLLGGKPLIAWTIEAALKTPNISEVYVTTESKEYVRIAEQWGAIVLMRPPELATSGPQSDEVFLYALRQLQYQLIEAETLILLQPTSPFRDMEDIRRSLEMYHEMNGEYTVFSGYRAKGFYWATNDEDEYIPVRHDPMFRLPRQSYDEGDWLVRENGAVYVVDAKKFSDFRTYRIPPFFCYVMDEERSIDIDEPQDFERAVAYLERVKA